MRHAVALVIVGAFLCCGVTDSRAQETEGLIPRLIKKWRGEKKPVEKPAPKQPTAVTPAKAAPVPQAARVAPSAQAGGAGTVMPAVDAMTREELIAEIREEVASEDEIPGLMPQLKVEKVKDGKDIVTLDVDGRKTRLEDLGLETLKKVWTSVNQLSTKINTERIQDQLATIRQTQALQQIARQQAVVARPPEIPRVPTVPPSAPQRPPAPPPQPPRR